MKVEVIKCDQCGTVKGESNGWTKAILFVSDESSAIVFFGEPEEPVEFRSRSHQSVVTIDLCGVGCAHRFLDSKIFAGQQSAGAPADERALTHDD